MRSSRASARSSASRAWRVPRSATLSPTPQAAARRLLLPACLPACLLPACVRALRPHEWVSTPARPRSSIGQLSGSTVDTVLRPVLPNPRLSPAQQQMRAARLTTASAGAVGIIIGCLVGCFPLLFIEGDGAEGKPEAA